MTKISTSQKFKAYSPQQALLLPPSLEELIGAKHLVRVVNEVVERMDLSLLIQQYLGGGTSAYHPRMLLKVLLYAYSVKIYTGRKIAQALSQDIHFMWLSGMSRPDFRTINNFRSSKAKEVIEVLFKEMLEFLLEHSYIKMENYFCDGSTFRADANQHKMVWKKNAERYKAGTEEKCRALFKEIDQLNSEEDRQYGKGDLEEKGDASSITPEDIQAQAVLLDKQLAEASSNKKRRKATSLRKKLSEAESKIGKYDAQIVSAGNRSGYNTTDEDASAMRMKNKVEVLPAYNVMAGSEQQFITGVSVHQNTNDGVCFKDHLEQVIPHQPFKPKNIIADSIFGTEQNYELLKEYEIENYMKFPLYHKEQTKKFKENVFLKENFPYDVLTDSYQCPDGRLLTFNRKYVHTHKRTGYPSTIKEYSCADCNNCPFYDQCCKATKQQHRSIQINEKLEDYKQQTRENLGTEKGTRLKKKRGVEIESCFGDIKHNMGFRRFHLRGLRKVQTEINLVAMAHNIRKICLQRQRKAS
ncbi:Transposase [Chitinophaga sp. CF118]|uniref:IS1182 family transposase n=1 Tax=Chitinophaga sp. CF118 TaxID=1884367 RepID=UPI0008E00074|nr:IS1182 family transposase [Chitinophaga sp. CF118]SFF12873.1 Transposase [Chitinophaga sp. CF118]